jgi:ferric-dicitrate binding protein FerR (iron transport regulator)
MGRKRRDEDQLSEDNATPADSAEGADAEPKPRRRRGRKLVLLAALAGAATYLVRRNQRKAELDEGIWHEAPTASATPSTPTAPTVG